MFPGILVIGSHLLLLLMIALPLFWLRQIEIQFASIMSSLLCQLEQSKSFGLVISSGDHKPRSRVSAPHSHLSPYHHERPTSTPSQVYDCRKTPSDRPASTSEPSSAKSEWCTSSCCAACAKEPKCREPKRESRADGAAGPGDDV